MEQQNALQKLEAQSIPFTEESYVKYARLGKVRMVRLFLEAGMPVDARDSLGWTALMVAAMEGKKNVVKLLISAGADINATNSEGSTPFLFALEYGRLEVAEMLISAGASIYTKPTFNWTALLYAVNRNFYDFAKRLIEAGLDVNQRGRGYGRSYNPLELAALNGNLEMLKLLLEAGAKINCDECSVVASAVQSKNIEVIKFVIEAGADVNAGVGSVKTTPLSLSMWNSRITKLLLDAGADIFQENIHQRNAYQDAVWWKVQNKSVLKLFEPAKPKLSQLDYYQGLYWKGHRPICENCLVWLEIGSRTADYDIDSWKCWVDGTTYVLKEGVYNQENDPK